MMNGKLTPILDPFGLVDGHLQRTPLNQIASREPASANGAKGTLLGLVEIQGNIGNLEMVEKRLATLAQNTYFGAQGGITAGLRRAVQVVNRWLHRHNADAPAENHLLGGIILAVLRDEDLFVAQVGPAALFARLNRYTQRYPDASPWLDATDAPRADRPPALGQHPFVEPAITHLQLQPGDVLVLTDGRLARHLPPHAAMQAIAGDDTTAIRRNLIRLSQVRRGSGLIVQMRGAPAARPAPQPAPPPAEKRPFALPTLPTLPAALGKGLHFSLPAALNLRPVAPRRTPPPPNAAPSPEMETSAAVRAAPRPALPDWRRLFYPLLGAMAFLGRGLRTILQLVLPDLQEDASPPPQAGGRVRVRREASAAPAASSRRVLQLAAVGLPLLVLVITLLMYWYRGYNRENEYQTALTLAQQKYQQAQTADPETARALLTEAEQHLQQAAAIKSDAPEIAALQISLQEERDDINGVQRLYYVPELRRYTDSGAQLRRVVVQGIHVYVLDSGLNRLYHHTLDDVGDSLLPDDSSPVLVQQGQSLDGLTVGEMLDMVWMPAGGNRQTSDLLVLQRDGLLEFDPDWGATPLAISGFERWQTPVAIASYFGNFYLLDAQANQIYRYLPTANGYEALPDTYFSPESDVDLQNAVDFAIDGAVYVLFADGQIRKFFGGQPAPFQLRGLDTPFQNPTAIFTAPDELVQYLYIADAGNQRIVQLTKEGVFVRQLKPRASDGVVFDDLRALYVDEIGQKLFVLNGSSLFAPSLPPAAKPNSSLQQLGGAGSVAPVQ